jgi:hypothetical protein
MKRPAFVVCVFFLFGCATSAAPIATQPRVAPPATPGKLMIGMQAATPVGGVIPADVSVTNSTYQRRRIDPTQVFAINDSGERIWPVPLSEAIRLASDAETLSAAVREGSKQALFGAAIGAAAGAIGGLASGRPEQGALIFGALGGGLGALSGISTGRALASKTAREQLQTLALQDRSIDPGYSVAGNVFFPEGNYKAGSRSAGQRRARATAADDSRSLAIGHPEKGCTASDSPRPRRQLPAAGATRERPPRDSPANRVAGEGAEALVRERLPAPSAARHDCRKKDANNRAASFSPRGRGANPEVAPGVVPSATSDDAFASERS